MKPNADTFISPLAAMEQPTDVRNIKTRRNRLYCSSLAMSRMISVRMGMKA